MDVLFISLFLAVLSIYAIIKHIRLKYNRKLRSPRSVRSGVK